MSDELALAVLKNFLEERKIYNLVDFLNAISVAVKKMEKPKSKWIDYKCECCGYGVEKWNTNKFCPNCGAEMEK